jgi:hypothetical protein
MLALFVDADPIAVWGLIVGIISAAIALIAAIAAIYAAVYAKAAPTKEDLDRVAENTAHLEEVRTSIASVDSRLKKQEEAERLKRRANRVSIAARGYQSGNVPLDLQLSVKAPQEPDFTLNHLELYNEHDLPFGSFPCERLETPSGLDYRAFIPMTAIGDWFRSGTVDEIHRRRRLKLKVWMSMNGVEVPRDIAVMVIQMEPGPYPAYDVQGSV